MNTESFPSHFGHFELLSKVGQGGMASIYRARSYGPDGFAKEMAIKRILPSLSGNQEFITQFLDEAQIAGSLSHPNIVEIYDLGQVEQDYYIAMEFVHGKHLGDLIRDSLDAMQHVPLVVGLGVVTKVAEALSFAHAATDHDGQPMNIVHRDVSPQNIMVSYTGAVKLTDFGIAKAANKLYHTSAGVIKGKFSYLAPEQLHGKPSSPASDIFSLGVVMWETLAGRRLFLGGSDIETIQLVQASKVPPLSEIRDDVPPQAEAILHKMLHSNPQHRYQRAHDLVLDLMNFLLDYGITDINSSIANCMGSLYPDEIQTEGIPPTEVSMPAVSSDELMAYAQSIGLNLPSTYNEGEKRPASEEQFYSAPTQMLDTDNASQSLSPLVTGGSQAETTPTPKNFQSLADSVSAEEAAEWARKHKSSQAPTAALPQSNQIPNFGSPHSGSSLSELDEDTSPTPIQSFQDVEQPSSWGRRLGILVFLLLLCAGVSTAFVLVFRTGTQGTDPEQAQVPNQVKVILSPETARLSLNGQKLPGQGRIRKLKDLQDGKLYKLIATHPDYETHNQLFRANNEQSFDLHIKLKPRTGKRRAP